MKKNRNKRLLEHKCKRTEKHKPFALLNMSRASSPRINSTGFQPPNVNLYICALLSFSLLLFSGCNSGEQYTKLHTKIDNLSEENNMLKSQIADANSEIEELKKRIVVLQDLPDDVKGTNLYHLENVVIQNYSGLFGENKDGEPNTLIVRLQPIDSHGDIIKAAGSVDVELWNLNKPENQSLIGKWHVGVEELKKDWNNFIITDYKLSFDISGKIKKFDQPLTIKMNFTDYLSGKVFQQQKVIEP